MSKAFCANCKFFKPSYCEISDSFYCKARPTINYVTGVTDYQFCVNPKGDCELYEIRPNWITRLKSKLFNRKGK